MCRTRWSPILPLLLLWTFPAFAAAPDPAKVQAEIIAMALVTLCFGIIMVYGAYLTYDEYRFESLTPGLGQPQWLHTGWLPLLSVFVIARAFGRAVRMWRGEDS